MVAYLDNAATTPMSTEVLEAMTDVFLKHYGNPSSMHSLGYEAECLVRAAKQKMARIFNCDSSELIITSGGTESINTAIYGIRNPHKTQHIVASSIEHSAVYQSMLEMEQWGNKISFVSVDKNGLLDIKALEQLLEEKTDLFNLIWVNNEIGSIQKVEEIIRLIRRKQPECLIHLDATQAIGKLKIDLSRLNIDLMSGSAHKLRGPKGVGLLYKRKSCNIKPLIFGGGQQGGFRSGTENVAGTVGMATAIEEAYKDFDCKCRHLRKLKERLIEKLSGISKIVINSPMDENYSDHILSLSIEGIRSEVILHELANQGVYVSAGSACHSNSKNKGSRTLNAIGMPKELQEGTIRLSLGSQLSPEDIDYAVSKFEPAIKELSKYVRK